MNDQPHSESEETSQNDVKTLLSWHAPGRPFQRRGKEYVINLTLIVAALAVMLLLIREILLILVVVSVAFIAYALRTIPPHDFYYRISSEGIMIEDHFFIWEELYDFYLKKIDKEEVIIVRVKNYFPGELMLTLGEVHATHVKSVLLQFLPFREYVRPTFTEKAGNWLARNFPLDRLPSK